MENVCRSKIFDGLLDVGVAGVFLYLKSPSSLEVRLFAGNLDINHQS